MDTRSTPDSRAGLTAVSEWLGSPVTVTLPGWGIVASASVLLILVFVALD
jgi:hypothetical protein